MPEITQANRYAKLKTPLKEDVLLLKGFQGSERLSQLFQFELDLLSEDHDIKFDDIIGKSVTITMETQGANKRYFNGIVSRFEQGAEENGFASYRATVVPQLWLLTRTSDCRVFQEKSVPDIIEQVLSDLGLDRGERRLQETYATREFCVQYRESAFNFISRLMEEEGIYYYFSHEDGKHTFVLIDTKANHDACPDYSEIIYRAPGEGDVDKQYIRDWIIEKEAVTGTFVHTDYDFEKPKTDILANANSDAKEGKTDFEIYDYPGEYKEKKTGDASAKIRIGELQTPNEIVRGETEVRGIYSGYHFDLKEYSRDDQNRKYLVTSVNHSAQIDLFGTGNEAGGGSLPYYCSFSAIPDDVQYRPPRITGRPVIQGPQTAIVVGPSGEEIYCDKYGRVKVQFHWDREGKRDENASCYIRVSQGWAGKSWGEIILPRIGQEVIVEFLEGNPDRPIITGRIYNADQMPPYSLPDNKTQSGIKTRSSKDANDKNFNELRFEDKKDEEEIYFHAEKNFNRVVENDDTLKVGFDKKDPGNQMIEIFNNRTLKVGNSSASDGSETVEIWKNRTETVKQGNRDVEVSMGNNSLLVKMGNQTTNIKMGKSETEAMQSIEFKVGQSSVKIDQTGVTIKGLNVKIEGQIQTDIKGAMTQINGSGMLKAGGGITMLG